MVCLHRIFKRILRLRSENSSREEEPELRDNPYLPYIREVLDQVLPQRGLDYGRMRLLVIDADTDPEAIFWEDEVLTALTDLSPDLNFLTILTNRAAYFQEYAEIMYQENGLLVCMEEKGKSAFQTANTVLDFERGGKLWEMALTEPSIYLPIYKKRWETAENLDIYVPIGYNTVIVKGILAVEKRGRML